MGQSVMTKKVVGYAIPAVIIKKALAEAGGDVDKALALARQMIVVGGREGTTEQAFEQLIAGPIRAARRIQ